MVEATGPEPPLPEVRLLAACLVAFCFVCYNELIKLKCSDITFNAEDMVINVQSSKTDHYREGASLVIAHTAWISNMPCEHDVNIYLYGEVSLYIPWNDVSGNSTDKRRREFCVKLVASVYAKKAIAG